VHRRLRSVGAAVRLGVALLGALLAGCSGEAPETPAAGATDPDAETEAADSARPSFPAVSVDAKLETFESLMRDLEAERHPADGGGRAWLERVEVATDTGEFVAASRDERGEPIVRVGRRARFHIVYEAGPHGVADGGVVFLQASPFWGWTTPQSDSPEGAGYTEVSTEATGVALEAAVAAEQLLAIAVSGRALAPGERIEILYGAGPGGTTVDRYAEREARLWIAVDGDGDGVRAIVPESPTVRVAAAPAAGLVLTLPTTAEPGDAVRLTVALLDIVGNAGVDFTGDVTLYDVPAGLELPERIRFTPEHRGRQTISGRVHTPGTFRIQGRTEGDPSIPEAESNPLVVRKDITPVLWGDLHGHSNLSDGTGTPEDSDHDHWGMPFIDESPELWERIQRAAAAHHEPGRFVTLLGYEWTSWLQGHRHVLYFDDPVEGVGSVLSTLDPRYQTPDELWAALAGKPVLTFAHHSAGAPVSTNWMFAPPPEIEPVTEITSVHGSSEAPDSPGPIYRPVAGNFVRDVLDAGYRFGFIGSGDSHDGHPGLATLATGNGIGGLAAISAEARTRDAVLAALRARRTYATNGKRIYLDVRLEGGALAFRVAALREIERIDFIRGGLTASVSGAGQRDIEDTREIPPLAAGEYLYLRVVQTDGGAAWSSPFYGD